MQLFIEVLHLYKRQVLSLHLRQQGKNEQNAQWYMKQYYNTVQADNNIHPIV